jgi:r-opsin
VENITTRVIILYKVNTLEIRYHKRKFAFSGTCSIMTMVVIGFDRYNVIVKGFSGTKITGGRAAGIIVILWAYSIIGCIPPFLGWGGYALG